MKKLLFLMGTTALMLGAFEAKAYSDAAVGQAEVHVVKVVEITHNDSDKLNFGQVYAKNDNTVVIGTDGTRSSGDGAGETSADHFTITGPNNADVTLTVPASTQLNNGDVNITVSLNPSVPTGTKVNMSTGTATINVGGSISVVASTPEGVYSGTYNVTVTY